MLVLWGHKTLNLKLWQPATHTWGWNCTSLGTEPGLPGVHCFRRGWGSQIRCFYSPNSGFLGFRQISLEKELNSFGTSFLGGGGGGGALYMKHYGEISAKVIYHRFPPPKSVNLSVPFKYASMVWKACKESKQAYKQLIWSAQMHFPLGIISAPEISFQ